jgi:hypothetical protein
MPTSAPAANPLRDAVPSLAPPPARRGRPPVFDEARRDHFCSLLRLGCTISKAAASVGVSRRGVLYAAKRDPELAERIRLVRLESRLDPITKIHSSRSWRAAAWLLERNSREFRLPPKPSAARRSEKLFRSKRLRRRIRRMVKELLEDPSEFTRNGK